MLSSCFKHSCPLRDVQVDQQSEQLGLSAGQTLPHIMNLCTAVGAYPQYVCYLVRCCRACLYLHGLHQTLYSCKKVSLQLASCSSKSRLDCSFSLSFYVPSPGAPKRDEIRPKRPPESVQNQHTVWPLLLTTSCCCRAKCSTLSSQDSDASSRMMMRQLIPPVNLCSSSCPFEVGL